MPETSAVKPPTDVLAAAYRIWMNCAVADDANLVKDFLTAKFAKPPTRMDFAARWVLALDVADAPSRYKSVDDFVARNKQTSHLPLGGRWPS